MGRKLMRVPRNFSWPLREVWGGYINPFWKLASKCQACLGTGLSTTANIFTDQWYGRSPFDPAEYGAEPLTVDSPALRAVARRNMAMAFSGEPGEQYVAQEAERLHRHWRGQWSHHLIQDDVDALLAADRLFDFTRVPRTEAQREEVRRKVADGGNSWLPESNGYRPTAREVNEWSMSGWGHDASNMYICVRARCQREGVEPVCSTCAGQGYAWPSAEIKRQHDAWQPTEPPDGDGFQLWETTSEGSQISPVFDTIESLCLWAADHATTFGSGRATASEWRQMLDDNLVCLREGNLIFL